MEIMNTSFIVYQYIHIDSDGDKIKSVENGAPPSSPVINLAPVCCTLVEISETVLRNQLLRRVSNGTTNSEGGGVFSAQLPNYEGDCGIYYHIIPKTDDTINYHHIICIVHEMKDVLESFQSELDQFILDYVAAVVTKAYKPEEVETVLNSWPTHTTEKLRNGVLLLKKIIGDVMAIAVIDGTIDLSSLPENDAKCIEAVFDIVSVFQRRDKGFTDQEKTFSIVPGSDNQVELANSRRPLDGDISYFDTAAQDVIAAAEKLDVMQIKQIIHNLHVKTAHDLNTVKRLVDQARDDYYALFRLHLFIENNRIPRLSLIHCFMQMDAFSDEEKMVLTLVHDFSLESDFPKVS